MELKQLRSYTAVVEQQSFTKASEVLFLSQPTISTHVATLEAELGVPLIRRTTQKLEVTRKGLEIYDYAVRILEIEARMKKACEPEEQRILHIGASTIPSAYILPETLPEFGRQEPDIYFVVHQGDSQAVIDGLKSGLYDVGLTGMAPGDSLIEFIPFCEDRLIIITPMNEHYLALKNRMPVSAEELLKEPVILRENGSGSLKSADRFLRSMNVKEQDLNVAARINDQEAIKNLVAGGLGISIISERAAANLLREKRILGFYFPEYPMTRQLYIARRKGTSSGAAQRRFISFLKKHYAGSSISENVLQ